MRKANIGGSIIRQTFVCTCGNKHLLQCNITVK